MKIREKITIEKLIELGYRKTQNEARSFSHEHPALSIFLQEGNVAFYHNSHHLRDMEYVDQIEAMHHALFNEPLYRND